MWEWHILASNYVASQQMRITLFGLGTVALAFRPSLNISPRSSSSTRYSTNKSPATFLQAVEKKDRDTESDKAAASPVEKAAWYGVEAFGKIFGGSTLGSRDDQERTPVLNNTGPPTSLAETKQRLKLDNDKSYFLSGQVDQEIYSPNCIFQDPFVSFEGRDRFIDNLQNLGSFITKYEARPLQYLDDDGSSSFAVVTTKFMVKLELNLPWKPVLAWPWGVRCAIDPKTNLIVRHEESVRMIVFILLVCHVNEPTYAHSKCLTLL